MQEHRSGAPAGVEARRLDRALRHRLEARALPDRILRGQQGPEEVLGWSLLGLAYFLIHWEQTLRTPPLDILIFPLTSLPSPAVAWAWVLAAVTVVVNGWWLDRWLARESGVENELRPPWRWIRRALGAVPVLGLLAVPLWRALVVGRSRWAFRSDENPRLVLAREPPSSPRCDRLRALRGVLDRWHARFAAVFVFAFWYFALGTAVLRFVVVELSERDGDALIALLVASIAALRVAGVALHGALLWHRHRRHERPAASLWLQAPLVATWLIPLPMSYLGALVGLAVVEWGRGRAEPFRDRERRLELSTGDIGAVGAGWRWALAPWRRNEVAAPLRERETVGRLLAFALIFEVALAADLRSAVTARYPSLWLPLAAIAAGGVVWVAARGLWSLGALARRRMQVPARNRQWQGSLAAQSRVLAVTALAMGYGFHLVLQRRAETNEPSLSLTFLACCSLAGLVAGVRLLVSLARSGAVDLAGAPWVATFAGLALIVGLLEQALPAARLDRPLVIALPSFAHVLAIRRLGWLIDPFPFSSAAGDAGDPARRRLYVAATLVMPLGLLAFPMALEALRRRAADFDRSSCGAFGSVQRTAPP